MLAQECQYQENQVRPEAGEAVGWLTWERVSAPPAPQEAGQGGFSSLFSMAAKTICVTQARPAEKSPLPQPEVLPPHVCTCPCQATTGDGPAGGCQSQEPLTPCTDLAHRGKQEASSLLLSSFASLVSFCHSCFPLPLPHLFLNVFVVLTDERHLQLRILYI